MNTSTIEMFKPKFRHYLARRAFYNVCKIRDEVLRDSTLIITLFPKIGVRGVTQES